MNITSITSILPFSDDRVIFLDIDGWTGQGIKINREYYLNFIRNKSKIEAEEKGFIKDISEEILRRTKNIGGIYILIGEDIQSTKDGIAYIGETHNFEKRMMNYFAGSFSEGDNENKDFCSEILFFSKKRKRGGETLDISLRRAIEAKIIEEARKSDKYEILNSNLSSNDLDLRKKYIKKEFFNKIKILLSHLGIRLLQEGIDVKEENTENYFICTERESNAIMYRGETGYVILEGSIIRKDPIDTFKNLYTKIFQRRKELIEKGILEEKDQKHFVLKKDLEFNSATAAADFVTGGHYSGNIAWRKKEDPNITLGEYLRKINY